MSQTLDLRKHSWEDPHAALLRRVDENFKKVAKGAHITIKLKVPAAIYVDKHLMRRMLVERGASKVAFEIERF